MQESVVDSELVDLSGVPLDAWPGLDLPSADACLRRLLSRIDDPAGSFGGYQPPREV
ncbi:hypothetical protein JCM4814A_75900 [Streptomyces phaeofaciens JCM 4814]|uniref:FXSXX-COOH protein n=1 Tax=Streptomyces phaeofaciens TaxID=68254 RepID=A0A918LXK8_9ACTN|nr:hypothetical protein [Streptomyces phaeofaciens]GGT64863.1 hypothetical protein GCM10010226_48340 [Streptomyces phaeofaciens]